MGAARQALLHVVRQAVGKPGEPARLASVRLASAAGTICVAIPLEAGGEQAFATHCDAALLVIWPSKPKAPARQLLRQVFGLSQAEAKVAELLAQGQTPQEIAALRSVGESTVRSHIKSIFHKTRVNRQHDLARLLAELAVVDAQAG